MHTSYMRQRCNLIQLLSVLFLETCKKPVRKKNVQEDFGHDQAEQVAGYAVLTPGFLTLVENFKLQ